MIQIRFAFTIAISPFPSFLKDSSRKGKRKAPRQIERTSHRRPTLPGSPGKDGAPNGLSSGKPSHNEIGCNSFYRHVPPRSTHRWIYHFFPDPDRKKSILHGILHEIRLE